MDGMRLCLVGLCTFVVLILVGLGLRSGRSLRGSSPRADELSADGIAKGGGNRRGSMTARSAMTVRDNEDSASKTRTKPSEEHQHCT